MIQMSQTPPLTALAITAHHDQWLAASGWPASEPAPQIELVWQWVQTNHRFNSLLWDEEDLARRTKRAIDRYNQARNDATERVDECLLIALNLVDTMSARTDAPQAKVGAGSRLHSETAGAMIDRLSIMSLKIRAMRAQVQRTDVDAAHIASSEVKLKQLLQQRADLSGCLDALLRDCASGHAHFKMYRQFKMYNDPRFNPVLVAEAKQA
jgi:hypothetical protein